MAIDWAQVPGEALDEAQLTGKQRQIANMLRQGQSKIAISRHLGVSRSTVQDHAHSVATRLNSIGWTPSGDFRRHVGAGQGIWGKSTQTRNEDGEIVWVKTRAEQSIFDAWTEAAEKAASDFKPVKLKKAPQRTNSDLLTVYTLTDFHLGMRAWAEETGDDWDIKIAEEVLINAFSDMMHGSPDSDTAVFAQLGDMAHWDGILAVTPTNQHVLDADTRFPKLVETAIRVLAKAAEMLLSKHKNLRILMAEGNHDLASSVWLRAIMSTIFQNNKRVSVEDSAYPYYSYLWGETFLGWHHGHLKKPDKLAMHFATEPCFRSDYGKAKHTYIHCGHQHHKVVIEQSGIHVEQHPTLAAKDAYASRGFPHSQRGASAITYSKTDGEVSRITIRPRYLK